MESRSRRNSLQSARVGLRGNAINRVLALHLGQFVVHVLAHLGCDAFRDQRGIIQSQSRGRCDVRLKRLARHALQASWIASEQQADFVVRPVALVNADFLAFALRKINQFVGHCHTGRLLQQRSQFASQRTAWNIGQSEGILNDGVVGAADFK